LVITKLADLSSPVLLQTCSAGKTIPKAKLEFMRADGNGQRIKYYEVVLENVLIGAVVPSIKPGDILTEHVSLKYGTPAATWRGGWDLTTNRIC
jgi:type VI secretion system secreted protein Hcp